MSHHSSLHGNACAAAHASARSRRARGGHAQGHGARTLTWLRRPIGKASTMHSSKVRSCIQVCFHCPSSARQSAWQGARSRSRGRTLRKTSLTAALVNHSIKIKSLCHEQVHWACSDARITSQLLLGSPVQSLCSKVKAGRALALPAAHSGDWSLKATAHAFVPNRGRLWSVGGHQPLEGTPPSSLPCACATTLRPQIPYGFRYTYPQLQQHTVRAQLVACDVITRQPCTAATTRAVA